MRNYLYGGILLALFACSGCGVASNKANGDNFVLPEQITEAGVIFDFAPGVDRLRGEMDDGPENKPENKDHQIFHLYLKGKPGKPRISYGIIKTGDHVKITSDYHILVNGIERSPE